MGDLQVTVKPKVGIDRLVFLMGYARTRVLARPPRAELDAEDDLSDALAEAFGRLAARALEQGVLQGYRTVDDTAAGDAWPDPRGGPDQRGVRSPFPLEVPTTTSPSTSPRTSAARGCSPAAPDAGLSRRTRQRCSAPAPAGRRHAAAGQRRAELAAVSAQRALPAGPAVAELILAGARSSSGSATYGQRVLFDMGKIFEDFVCVALRER